MVPTLRHFISKGVDRMYPRTLQGAFEYLRDNLFWSTTYRDAVTLIVVNAETAKYTDQVRVQDRHRLLHILWTKAVGTKDYNKDEWKQLSALLALDPVVTTEEAVTSIQGGAQTSTPTGSAVR